MKNIIQINPTINPRIFLVTLFLALASITSFSQERHGSTLNLGVGIGGYSGYYKNVGANVPVIHLDYELNVGKNFTLAPFINFYSYTATYRLNNPSREYIYRVNILPIGIKGTYYLDDLLQAGPKWDFYVAGSLAFAFVRSSWNDNYYVNNGFFNGYYSNHGNQLYLNGHVGAEYHINNRVGIFLDFSNGLSTAGLAIH